MSDLGQAPPPIKPPGVGVKAWAHKIEDLPNLMPLTKWMKTGKFKANVTIPGGGGAKATSYEWVVTDMTKQPLFVPSPAAVVPGEPAPGQRMLTPVQRSNLPIYIGIGVVGVLALGGALWFAFGRKG
jgi:hypothetical protein